MLHHFDYQSKFDLTSIWDVFLQWNKQENLLTDNLQEKWKFNDHMKSGTTKRTWRTYVFFFKTKTKRKKIETVKTTRLLWPSISSPVLHKTWLPSVYHPFWISSSPTPCLQLIILCLKCLRFIIWRQCTNLEFAISFKRSFVPQSQSTVSDINTCY